MNENFDIKCTNILKGEQPDKTNHFHKIFYKAATNGNDNSVLIQKYLEKKSKKEEKKRKIMSCLQIWEKKLNKKMKHLKK